MRPLAVPCCVTEIVPSVVSYQFLAFDFDETVDVTRDNCRLLMVRLKLDGYLMDREKIFLKYFNEEYMSRSVASDVHSLQELGVLEKRVISSDTSSRRTNSI